MLKAHVNDELWLVQQPHHAQLSGFLAAHWGSAGGFARPGRHAGAAHPETWHDEVILAIAEHDNGWWETEAMPRISERDGWPVGVGEAAPATDANEFTPWIIGGFDRWHLGVDRLAATHPYAALLVSLHASWLYTVAFEDLMTDGDDALRHPVFGAPELAPSLVTDPVTTRAFLAEQRAVRQDLSERLRRDPRFVDALAPEHLRANFRLLQLLDSMSLFLSLNDERTHTLRDVPRGGWFDRVSITWSRIAPRTIALAPYPFDTDALVVPLPARVVPAATGTMPPTAAALRRLHAAPLRSIDFTFVRGASDQVRYDDASPRQAPAARDAS